MAAVSVKRSVDIPLLDLLAVFYNHTVRVGGVEELLLGR